MLVGEAPEHSPRQAPHRPQLRTEVLWQLADTITWFVPDRLGDHTFKSGIDVSLIQDDSYFPNNFEGTFTFDTDRSFDELDPATYPSLYTRSDGDPNVYLRNRIYGAFFQDQWKPRADVTVNAGIRWDYEDGPGISRDINNVAPRLGIAIDPAKSGKTAIRASYGIYYDQINLGVARNAVQGLVTSQTRIRNPGYPDPFGYNPRRAGSARATPPSTTRFAEGNRTPYTEEVSAGVGRELSRSIAVIVDGVWARGRNLLRLGDANYPDLTDPLRRRPNAAFNVVQVTETRGNSWYKGLHVGFEKRHANSHSYAIAYTLSSSERDTHDTDAVVVAQDQRVDRAERGPSLNDSRHRFTASMNLDLVRGFRLTAMLTSRSAVPYNITTGGDENGDTFFTDRPAGVGRNSGRGDNFWQLDARLSRPVTVGRWRLELLAEAFNLTNHRNWTDYEGNLASANFGHPTNASTPREVQLGIRADF